MPVISANGIELYYDRFGDPAHPTLLMVSGLGAQCVGYDDALCEQLASHGFDVVRYDNRDVGLSTWFSDASVDAVAAFLARMGDQHVEGPYSLSDMAADGIGLLNALGVEHAHVLGASMGGMIVQTMAIEHPERLLSAAIIMSTTGEQGVGMPNDEVLSSLVTTMDPNARPATREERIAGAIELARLIGTPNVWTEEHLEQRHSMLVDRAYNPEGMTRQFVAIMKSGSRAEALPAINLRVAVLHGDVDPLVNISGGHRTAELIPGASFHLLDGMGHDLPAQYWDDIVVAVVGNIDREVQ
jgi:hypothetical protein